MSENLDSHRTARTSESDVSERRTGRTDGRTQREAARNPRDGERDPGTFFFLLLNRERLQNGLP